MTEVFIVTLEKKEKYNTTSLYFIGPSFWIMVGINPSLLPDWEVGSISHDLQFEFINTLQVVFITLLLGPFTSAHSPLPLASWILHSLPSVAATNSRDEPSWLVACSVWNVNWQVTAPAPRPE